LIATPEYNGSLSGALKNAVDWCSRPGGDHDRSLVFAGKVAAIMSAGPGGFRGPRAPAPPRRAVTSGGGHVLPPEIAVPHVGKLFAGESAEPLDDAVAGRLREQGSALVRMLEALRAGARA